MQELFQVKISGIKCDTEGCDFVDETVKVEDYDQWLNKPCPKCSGNLLTEADYNNVQMLLQTQAFIKSLTTEQIQQIEQLVEQLGINAGLFTEENKNDLVHMKMEMNGTGKVKIDIVND